MVDWGGKRWQLDRFWIECSTFTFFKNLFPSCTIRNMAPSAGHVFDNTLSTSHQSGAAVKWQTEGFGLSSFLWILGPRMPLQPPWVLLVGAPHCQGALASFQLLERDWGSLQRSCCWRPSRSRAAPPFGNQGCDYSDLLQKRRWGFPPPGAPRPEARPQTWGEVRRHPDFLRAASAGSGNRLQQWEKRFANVSCIIKEKKNARDAAKQCCGHTLTILIFFLF